MTDRRALVIDVDGTLCPIKGPDQDYQDLEPYQAMVRRLVKWRHDGFRIILFTSRNMQTFEGNIGLINTHTAPILIDWLARWEIPYDELHFGKPWPGRDGFYIDDRAVRPDEFLRHTEQELHGLIEDSRARLMTMAAQDA